MIVMTDSSYSGSSDGSDRVTSWKLCVQQGYPVLTPFLIKKEVYFYMRQLSLAMQNSLAGWPANTFKATSNRQKTERGKQMIEG